MVRAHGNHGNITHTTRGFTSMSGEDDGNEEPIRSGGLGKGWPGFRRVVKKLDKYGDWGGVIKWDI